ncbi:uncharacterized protein LOC129987445 [Argiope bruennichi]|uniref:uncharacterized protein LOC129987445 n=1 Tax=Argiope bruennichi TaxID=94029 RepID=UPI002494EA5A|nr:uncharacterized protein LOC129987445 [Argiope bruennichi]
MNILLIGDSMIKRLEAHLSEDLDVIFYRGTTIERLTSRISKIKKHCDWILVHVGTNNISVDSVEIILQKYRSLANEILRVNPKKTVEHIKILNHKIEAVNKALEKLCHNEDAFIFCSSNKPSWSGFLGKDGLHTNKSGDLRLANYFCRLLKKCISSDNASRKRKNCQLITSGYILDSLEFPPLPSCDQPSFLSSWPQHSGSAVPCSEVLTFVDPVPSYVSSFPSASQKDQKCQSIAPKFILDSTEFPALSSSRQSSFLSSWSKHPASWPFALPSVSACAVSTASCSLPPSPPVPRSLPPSPPVPPTGHVQFLVPIVSYMPMVQFMPFHSVAVSYPPFYVPVVPPFLPAAVSSLPTCSLSVVACTLPTHSEPEPACTSPVHSEPGAPRISPAQCRPACASNKLGKARITKISKNIFSKCDKNIYENVICGIPATNKFGVLLDDCKEENRTDIVLALN